MKSRIVAVFSMILILAGLLIVRLLTISTQSDYVAAVGTQTTYSLKVCATRGRIYDCKKRPIAGGKTQYRAIIAPSGDTIAHLTKVLEPDEFLELENGLLSAHPFVAVVKDGTIEGSGVTVLKAETRYGANYLAAHTVGYLGGSGHGVSGIEAAFDDYLSSAEGELTALYRVDARGRSIEGIEPELNDTTENSAAGVVLTLDCDIQQTAETAADMYLKQGAVVVLELPDGAVRASVSRPNFSPQDVGDYLDADNSPLLDRAISAYDVGSVFKLVVAAAALQSGIDPDWSCCCEGCVTIGKNTFNCSNRSGHGEVDMEQALAQSCNVYFIELAKELGGDIILEYAKKFGFGEGIALCDNYRTASGCLPGRDTLELPAALANFAFGQGELMVTPMHLARLVATIANDGVDTAPYILLGKVNSQLDFTQTVKKSYGKSTVSSDTAALLRRFMLTAVQSGTAKRGASDNVTSAAKTGTAQTGIIRGNHMVLQAWYAGFFPFEKPKYVVIVLAEDGESGGSTAAPVFKYIADRLAASCIEKSF